MPPSSSGPGCQVLSLKTGVQIPLGVHIIAAIDAMETIHPIKRISSPISAVFPIFNLIFYNNVRHLVKHFLRKVFPSEEEMLKYILTLYSPNQGKNG